MAAPSISETDFKILSTLITKGQNRELANLGKRLMAADVVNETRLGSTVVRLNSEVEIHDHADKRTTRLKIVLPEDMNLGKKHISVFAPICVALFGHDKGDTVTLQMPGGEKQITIIDVKNNSHETISGIHLART